jgi:fumarate hydratase class II
MPMQVGTGSSGSSWRCPASTSWRRAARRWAPGLNTSPGWAETVAANMAEITGLPFVTAPNKFEALAAHDAMVFMSGALKTAAMACYKIANDIRFLGSGPRCGPGRADPAGERAGLLDHAGQGEPDPGRGDDAGLRPCDGQRRRDRLRRLQGHFELNVYNPMMAYNLLQSMQLLGDAAPPTASPTMLMGTGEANEERIDKLMRGKPDAGDGAGARRPSATTTPPRSPRPRTRTAPR